MPQSLWLKCFWLQVSRDATHKGFLMGNSSRPDKVPCSPGKSSRSQTPQPYEASYPDRRVESALFYKREDLFRTPTLTRQTGAGGSVRMRSRLLSDTGHRHRATMKAQWNPRA